MSFSPIFQADSRFKCKQCIVGNATYDGTWTYIDEDCMYFQLDTPIKIRQLLFDGVILPIKKEDLNCNIVTIFGWKSNVVGFYSS